MKSKEAKYSEGVIYAWTELLIKKIMGMKNFSFCMQLTRP